jgi:hypothetical protein
MPIQYSRHSDVYPLPKVIYLFGHRQGHGKDVSCDILQEILRDKQISNCRTLFAKMLKKHVADRYGLDVAAMEKQEYKASIVPHAKPKIKYIDEATGQEVPTWVYMDPGSLKIKVVETPRTVRDILIEEGRFARSIWGDTWAWQVYKEIFDSGMEIGIVSDYRYPNESDPDGKLFDLFVQNKRAEDPTWKFVKPKIIKIQVYRKDGIFANDGADAELPDDFSFYDYNIMNETRADWRDNLKSQLLDILSKTYEG